MALNQMQRSSLCLGVHPTPGMPHSLNSLSTVARSSNAPQMLSNDEEACTAQGAEAPFISTTAVPTSGVSTRGDDMGSDDMAPTFADVAFRQLLAAGGTPTDTRILHVILAACGIPSATDGVPAQATHVVPAARSHPSAAGGPSAAI